jgi:hypothetical protein
MVRGVAPSPSAEHAMKAGTQVPAFLFAVLLTEPMNYEPDCCSSHGQMNGFFRKTGAIYPFVMLSMVGHFLCVYLWDGVGTFRLATPVTPLMAVIVTLKGPDAVQPQPAGKEMKDVNTADRQPTRPFVSTEESGHGPQATSSNRSELSPPTTVVVPAQGVDPLSTVEHKASDIPKEGNGKAVTEDGVKVDHVAVSTSVSTDYGNYKGQVRRAGEFLSTRREKLTYRISLLKIPVGSAVMEAANNDGELRISVRITSNAAMSGFYAVDDLVETRMIKGDYLLTRVRQNEGSYRGDFGFTLMLREHKAFWVDRLRNRYDYQPLPGDDVMDAVSGFYFLRNRDLEVGKSVQLNLFDSNEYSPTTVEVLRRERIGLPGSRDVNTLVLHPLFKTAGFFRRTGDITIWLTDDKYRVPVRMETFITLGKVTADLIASEREQEETSRTKELPGKTSDKTGRTTLGDLSPKGEKLLPSFACN